MITLTKTSTVYIDVYAYLPIDVYIEEGVDEDTEEDIDVHDVDQDNDDYIDEGIGVYRRHG